jgi:pimeloyl-ACP methyl ester carboxylesterase
MKLSFREVGENGDPIIVMHGLLGASDNWLTISRQWAEKFHVFLLDLRNHGKSPHHYSHTYTDMAEDVNDFMHDHSLKQAHVVGHSMGGKVAMTFAIDYPQKVKKLVVVDIAPKKYNDPQFIEILEILSKLPVHLIDSRSEADEWLAKYIPDNGLRQFLLKNLSRDDKNRFYWRVNVAALLDNIPEITAAVKEGKFEGPTLFIRGAKSNYIKDEDIALIKKYFTNARVETVADAGHWVHAEKPEAVKSLIEDFLSD